MRERPGLWRVLSRRPQAEAGEVQVLSAWLDVPGALRERLWTLLSPDERARARRFRFAVHRDRFVAARGLLREILGAFLGVQPGRLVFDYGARGKPSLARPFAAADLRFNLAHADRLAVYAIALGRDVGVDVERVRPLPDAEGIAARFFSSREQRALGSLAAPEREEAFFACWTRKEAFLKATGDGLSRDLGAFDVSVVPSLPARLERVAGDPLEAGRWSMEEIRPAPGYRGAVAFAGRARVSCREWTREPEERGLDAGVEAARGHELEAR